MQFQTQAVYGRNVYNQLAGSVIPSVVAGGARSYDKHIRDVRTPLDAIKARGPVLSETLPVKLTVWGEPIERPGTPISRFISPMQVSESKGSPIEREVERLNINIGMPNRKVRGIELSPEEYYDFVKNAGVPAAKLLNRLISESSWSSYSEDVREKIIKGVVSKYREQETAKMTMQLLSDKRLSVQNGMLKPVGK